MRKSDKAKLRKLINRYADSKIALSWAGGGDPAHYEDIDEEGKATKKALYKFIRELDEEEEPTIGFIP